MKYLILFILNIGALYCEAQVPNFIYINYNNKEWSVPPPVGKSFQYVSGVTLKPGFVVRGQNGAWYARPVQNSFSTDLNFVRTETVTQEGVKSEQSLISLPVTSKTSGIEYIDGLGRKVQSVIEKSTPAYKDVVTPVVYDAYGRIDKSYLPYPGTNSGGAYRSNAVGEQVAYYKAPSFGVTTETGATARTYTQHTFEPSPLRRELSSLGPGGLWTKTTSALTKIDVGGNVHRWQYNGETTPPTLVAGTYYAANILAYSEVKDEADHINRVFTDFFGRTVLKEVQTSATTWNRTYFIYDDLGNLCIILPPEAVANITGLTGGTTTQKQAFLDKWAFQYVYDGFQRLIKKKLPGTGVGWEYFVYDQWDRLVLSQDAVQRKTNEWSFVKYDVFNREIMSGVFTTASTHASLQTTVQAGSGRFENPASTSIGYTLNLSYPTSGITETNLRAITYYDNYNFLSYSGWDAEHTNTYYSYDASGFVPTAKKLSAAKGQTTGSKVKVLGTSTWLNSVTYYDFQYRSIQTITENLHNGCDKVFNDPDFVGRERRTKWVHAGQESVTILKEFTYDHAGRLLTIKQTTGTTSPVILVSNKYNELGQLIEKNLHSADNGATFLQSLDYRYNIRGQLTHINNSTLTSDGVTNDDTNDYFGMELVYNQRVENVNGVNTTPLDNGNISAIRWKTKSPEPSSENIYGFTYDYLNRMQSAKFASKNGALWNANPNQFNESATYDRQGNILTLSRNGLMNKTTVVLDNLTYGAYDGSKLLTVTDNSSYYNAGDNNPDYGFREISHANLTEFTYDENGRMTGDMNKGITSITYNLLDMPEKIQLENNRWYEMVYDALGNKLRMKVMQTVSGTPYTLLNEDYVGGIHYRAGKIAFITTEEGRAVRTNTGYDYEYFLKDHQSNTRAVVGYLKETAEFFENMEHLADQVFANMPETRDTYAGHNHTPKSSEELAPSRSLELTGFGSNGDLSIGPVLERAVTAGDRIQMECFARYNSAVSSNSIIPNLVSLVARALSIPLEDARYQILNSSLPGYSASIGRGTNAPKGYMCYMIFDKNHAPRQFGYARVSTVAMAGHERLALDITVPVDGFLYFYIANETNVAAASVFFDDVKLIHESNRYGPQLVQRSDFYPFGLSFNQKTYQRIAPNNGTTTLEYKPNAYLFQGQEGLSYFGLDMYHFKFRLHDPALGRFSVIDPLAEEYEFNSPYAFSENRLVDRVELEGKESMVPYSLMPALANLKNGYDYHMDQNWDSWDGGYLTGLWDWMAAGFRSRTETYGQIYTAQADQKFEERKKAQGIGIYDPEVASRFGSDIFFLGQAANNKARTLEGYNAYLGDHTKAMGLVMGTYSPSLSLSGSGGNWLSSYLRGSYNSAAKWGTQGGLNLFKFGSHQATKSTGWKVGDRFLQLPKQGTPKLNWAQNSGFLRAEMKLGNPIFDSYRLPNGTLIPTGGFLNAERSLLQTRGWTYNPGMGAWTPPGF